MPKNQSSPCRHHKKTRVRLVLWYRATWRLRKAVVSPVVFSSRKTTIVIEVMGKLLEPGEVDFFTSTTLTPKEIRHNLNPTAPPQQTAPPSMLGPLRIGLGEVPLYSTNRLLEIQEHCGVRFGLERCRSWRRQLLKVHLRWVHVLVGVGSNERLLCR